MDFPPFKKSVCIGVSVLNWKLVFLYGSARKKKKKTVQLSKKIFFYPITHGSFGIQKKKKIISSQMYNSV